LYDWSVTASLVMSVWMYATFDGAPREKSCLKVNGLRVSKIRMASGGVPMAKRCRMIWPPRNPRVTVVSLYSSLSAALR
jgi:hypothetical protein